MGGAVPVEGAGKRGGGGGGGVGFEGGPRAGPTSLRQRGVGRGAPAGAPPPPPPLRARERGWRWGYAQPGADSSARETGEVAFGAGGGGSGVGGGGSARVWWPRPWTTPRTSRVGGPIRGCVPCRVGAGNAISLLCVPLLLHEQTGIMRHFRIIDTAAATGQYPCQVLIRTDCVATGQAEAGLRRRHGRFPRPRSYRRMVLSPLSSTLSSCVSTSRFPAAKS